MNKKYESFIRPLQSLGARVQLKLNQCMFKRTALALPLWVCLAASALAQERNVSGKITDSGGTGIPGVNVIIKGTASGTATDADGNFSVSAPVDAVLVFTGVGYKAVERAIGNESQITLSMEEDQVALEEVVVTGYTVDNRREVAGSVATVKAQDLTVAPSGNVEQQLQGRVSGVTVITNGQPGTTSQIRVRGFGSFENNEPLYVVDGVPVNTTDFLNPDDIETVTVLKDAPAASIYGARASGGVIVYTTKQGKRKAKKLSVTYDGLFGVTTPGKGIEKMNSADYVEWTRIGYINSGIKDPHPQFGALNDWKIPDYLRVGERTGVRGNIDLSAEEANYNVTDFSKPLYQVVATNKEGTDWYKEATRNAPLSRHTIGISGGGENSRYHVGFGLQDQEGILKNNSFKRYSFRANTEFDIFKNVRMGENLQLTYRQALGLSGSEGGKGISTDENDFFSSYLATPLMPVHDVFGGYAGNRVTGLGYAANPVANRDRAANNKGFNTIGFGNVYLEAEPIKGLTLRSSLGGNYRSTTTQTYSPANYENIPSNLQYEFEEKYGYSFAWTLTNTAGYKKVFGGKHSVDFLLGQESLDDGTGRNVTASGSNPFSSDPNYIAISTVNRRQASGNQFKGVKFFSLFGQLRYVLSDKYIVGAVLRRDGSSRFGAGSRYGVFPAFSAAWRISGESFMQPLKWVNDLKLRAGYGTVGNSNAVDPNNRYTLYASNLGQSYYDVAGSNKAVTEGYYRSQIGNPDAKWESSTTQNAGLDATLFANKLEVIIDFWEKNTKDLLVQLPLPGTDGFQARTPFVNTAQMLNRGLDIQLITRGTAGGGGGGGGVGGGGWGGGGGGGGGIAYEFSLNGSFLQNEITGIRGGLSYLESINPSFRAITPIRNQLGHSLSAFYGYQVAGLFNNKAEVDAVKQKKAAPGRFRFADINGPGGKPDGEITDLDRTYLGSPIPKFTGGANLMLKYKHVEVSAYLYASMGNKIYNLGRWWSDFYAGFTGMAISPRVRNSWRPANPEAPRDSWTPANPEATIPLFENASNFSTNTQSSSFYIESGNYLRMQNLSLAYHFPTAMRNALKAERLKVFLSANNLFTLTNYSGLDPGVGGAADTVFGIDQGNYPVTRSFTVGISVGF